ncbi:hypothetical protein [Coleofasciculus sp.]|uniref:hypothetical protein n=1 Tax=Coleofasciculus sp. TaxID=3100458 RepID=UPI003A210CED
MKRSPAPEPVQAGIAQPTAWLDIQPIENQPDVGLIDLDVGEQAAIRFGLRRF